MNNGIRAQIRAAIGSGALDSETIVSRVHGIAPNIIRSEIRKMHKHSLLQLVGDKYERTAEDRMKQGQSTHTIDALMEAWPLGKLPQHEHRLRLVRLGMDEWSE